MPFQIDSLHPQTRRHLFGQCGIGLGSLALSKLLGSNQCDADSEIPTAHNHRTPLEPRSTHFPAKAKRVIFLFMAGGPSQLDLFDYKPELTVAAANQFPLVLLRESVLLLWIQVTASICSAPHGTFPNMEIRVAG